MALVLKRSPTITGGTDATYKPDGYQANGKARFLGPENTYLLPEVLLIGVSVTNPSGNNLGKATSTHQLVFGDKTTEEGCCTVVANQISGSLVVDVALGLDSTIRDKWIADFRAYVNNQAFVDAIVTGNRPS